MMIEGTVTISLKDFAYMQQEQKRAEELEKKLNGFRDEVTANLQDEAITDEDREKKNDELMGRFMWQMMKLQQMQS